MLHLDNMALDLRLTLLFQRKTRHANFMMYRDSMQPRNIHSTVLFSAY